MTGRERQSEGSAKGRGFDTRSEIQSVDNC